MADASPEDSYDVVPYESHPFAHSHPDRLATIATLFGMLPQPVDRCRVLEIGCAAGGNLIPIAERFPESQFIGIDLSQRQIADGRLMIDALGLKNIKLLQQNLMDIGPDFGQFDYIIVHGVFTWVPRQVQAKLLEVCSKNLCPSGVAYVSYNTYPGWRMRGLLRSMLLYHTRSIEKPADRIRQARALLEFLPQLVPAEESTFRSLLTDEVDLLRKQYDYYLYHEHLEGMNEPVYFHQFVDQAEAMGLQYLGEAKFWLMRHENSSDELETTLRTIAGNLIEVEQYFDFLKNRAFRETLLCHQEIALNRTISAERSFHLHVASHALAESPELPLQSDGFMKFVGPTAVMTTNNRLIKAAMLHLGEIYPRSVSFFELLAAARARIRRESVLSNAAENPTDAQKLAETIIASYAKMHVELSTCPSGFTLERSEAPCTTPVVRYQIKSGSLVTNRRHESVLLSDLQRHAAGLLDGRNTRDTIVDHLVALVRSAVLAIYDNGQPVNDERRARSILSKNLEQSLEQMASNALLI